MTHINISEEDLRAKMKAESWLTEEEALEMGFATEIAEEETTAVAAQSAKKHLFEMLRKAMQAEDEKPEDEETDDGASEPSDAPENAADDEDEEESAGDEETADDGDSEPENKPDEESDEDDPEPAQKWSGFFNALFRE